MHKVWQCVRLSGGTTNLRNHLLTKHSSMYKAADDKTQRKLTFKAQKCSKGKEKEITYHIPYTGKFSRR